MNVIFVLLLIISAAYGQKFTDKNHPCHLNYQLHCKLKQEPTQQNKFFCLNVHFNELQPGCQDYIVKNIPNETCRPDIMKLCQGSHRNLGLYFKCLVSMKDSLSKACRIEIEAAEKAQNTRAETLKKACTKEEIEMCKQIKLAERKSCQVKKFREKAYSPACLKVIESMFKPQK